MNTGVRNARVDDHFGETATLSRYLAVEVALARVQAELGVIPAEAARSIAAAACVENIGRVRYRQSFELVGFPIVGLVQQLADVVPSGHGQFAHWGATTQDIMDSALVMGLRDVLDWVGVCLDEIISSLAALAERHRRTPMIGRSQLQHAVPITFGYKVAGWIGPLLRHRTRLEQLRPRLLQVQLGGAVGTLAALGPRGSEVRRRLAGELGLEVPVSSWHTQRDALAEMVSSFAVLGGSLSKIATDVVYLAQTEVAELREPSVPGRGTSSTMPQKHNPILSQQIIVAARLLRAQSVTMLETMVQDHERGSATWQAEWTLIPDAASYMLAALERMRELGAGLRVEPDRMRMNLDATGGFVYAEAVMMHLATELGRQRAHDLVAEAVAETREGKTFLQSLLGSREVSAAASEAELREILAGQPQIEAAARVVGDVLAACPSSLARVEP